MDQTAAYTIADRAEHVRSWLVENDDILKLKGIAARYGIPQTMLFKWVNKYEERGRPVKLTDVHVENLERVLQPLGYVPLTSNHQFL